MVNMLIIGEQCTQPEQAQIRIHNGKLVIINIIPIKTLRRSKVIFVCVCGEIYSLKYVWNKRKANNELSCLSN